MSRDHGRRGPQNIDALQMLRAVAALLVVMWHSRLSIMHANNNYWVEGDFLYRASHYPAFLNHLDIGVDIFFCISGFIMNLLIHDEPSTSGSALAFATKRAVRIFPPYWFFTGLVLLAYVASRGRFNLASLTGNIASDGGRLLTSLLLVPEELPPILGVGWTLIHECLFYLLCALSIAVGLNRRLPTVLALFSLGAIGLTAANVSLMHGYFASPFTIEFLCGALAFKYRKPLSRFFPGLQLVTAVGCYLAVSAILDSGISTQMMPFVRSVGSGIIGALLICGLIGANERICFSRSLLGAGLMRIGDASYSLYLSHWLVLSTMGKLIWLIPALPAPGVAAWHVLSILAAISFAVIFAEHVEIPIHKRLQAAFLHARTVPVASG